MSKQCDRFVEEILSTDGKYTDEVQKHIRRCPACRVIASEWQSVRAATERCETPDILDFAIRNAASSRHVKLDYWRHIIYRLVSITAAAACVLLLIAIFMFDDKRLLSPYNAAMNANPSATKWISRIDKGLLSLDTEIELNRQLLYISQDQQVNFEDILFPEETPDPAAKEEYPIDEDYLL